MNKDNIICIFNKVYHCDNIKTKDIYIYINI